MGNCLFFLPFPPVGRSTVFPSILIYIAGYTNVKKLCRGCTLGKPGASPLATRRKNASIISCIRPFLLAHISSYHTVFPAITGFRENLQLMPHYYCYRSV